MKKAFQWNLKAANQGDVDAQREIAHCYEVGEGVEKDCKKSFDWTLKAAEQGCAESQFGIAVMYYSGCNDTNIDIKNAFKWLQKAANGGHSLAQTYTADCYAYGDGVEFTNSDNIFLTERLLMRLARYGKYHHIANLKCGRKYA